MKKIDYDWILNLLKTATYSVVGFIGTYIAQAIQGGASIKDALIIGVSMGVTAGVKNLVKYKWNIDLDFTKLKN